MHRMTAWSLVKVVWAGECQSLTENPPDHSRPTRPKDLHQECLNNHIEWWDTKTQFSKVSGGVPHTVECTSTSSTQQLHYTINFTMVTTRSHGISLIMAAGLEYDLFLVRRQNLFVPLTAKSIWLTWCSSTTKRDDLWTSNIPVTPHTLCWDAISGI